MITSVFRQRWLPALLAAVAAAVLVAHAATPPDVTTLAVAGRSNATPWVAASGNFVAVAWGASSEGKTDVYLAVSRNAGQTFGSPVQVNPVRGEAKLGGEQPARVALAPRGGSLDPEIVVLWGARSDKQEIRTARSRDGGKTFAAPVTLQSPDAAGARGWPALALDARGTAHAIWLDHRGMAAPAAGAGHEAHQRPTGNDGVAMAQKSALFYAVTTGTTSTEREVTRGVCYCCKTALTVGPDGAIYGAWRQVYPGNFRDMAFTVSRDSGRSFSAPVRVSEDKWAIEGCPDDGPAIAADAGGTVHLIWPTVVGGANPEGALFYASTRDGRTFTARVRIPSLGSPKASHPQIAADASGRVVVAWDELLNGRRVAAARELKTAPDGKVTFGSVITLSPEGPAIYPILAATRNGLLAVWATGGDGSIIQTRAIRLP